MALTEEWLMDVEMAVKTCMHATADESRALIVEARNLNQLRASVQAFLDSCPDGIERYNPKMAGMIAAMKTTE